MCVNMLVPGYQVGWTTSIKVLGQGVAEYAPSLKGALATCAYMQAYFFALIWWQVYTFINLLIYLEMVALKPTPYKKSRRNTKSKHHSLVGDL